MSSQVTSSCSVIVYTENRPSICASFLTSLAGQTVLPQQLILVDKSHQSVMQDVAIQQLCTILTSKHIQLIYQYAGTHAVYSRNQAVAQAIGKIIYFFDETVVLDPHYIQQMQTMLLEHSCYAGGMGRICTYGQEYSWLMKTIKAFFCLAYAPAKRVFTISGSYAYPHTLTEIVSVCILDSSCMAFRRAIFAKHTFHESLNHDPELQALDFSYRMSCYAPLVYYPEACAWYTDEKYRKQEKIKYASYLFFTYINRRCSWRTMMHYWSLLGCRFVRGADLMWFAPFRVKSSA
jgi:GT2 family glycosyltransferase